MAYEYCTRPVVDLIPYASNSRTHDDKQVSQVAASIREWGFTNPILIDEENTIIAGHGRALAAKQLDMLDVPCIILSGLTAGQKKAYVIADNKLALNAGWDEDMLSAEVQSLEELGFDVGLLGFDDVELADLRAGDETEGLTDEDAVPEAPETPITVDGDVWTLGNHRLMCGDSTSIDAVERLMDGQKADMVFTDPPYNVAYEGYTKDKLQIQNDAMSDDEFIDFLLATFASYRVLVKDGAGLYVCHGSSMQREFQDSLEAAGFTVRCQIIWAKNTFAWGMGRYKFQHEPIFYCYVTKQTDAWYGDKSQSTLWQENKPAANRLHPTMKPVELVERALVNSSKSGDIVADLFGGSGSTLIACQKTNRDCRTMELDQKYCDVIIKRWQDYTGKDAVNESGETFDSMEVAS